MHCGFTALPEKPLKSGNLKIIQPGVASVAHTSHIHCRYVYIYCIIYAIYVLYASLRYSSLLMHTMHAKSSSLLTSPHHKHHAHGCMHYMYNPCSVLFSTLLHIHPIHTVHALYRQPSPHITLILTQAQHTVTQGLHVWYQPPTNNGLTPTL